MGAVVLLVLAASMDVWGQWPREFGSLRRATGAGVAPVFEGWEPNPDGTFTLYFGYMNRNWDEEVDIPVGPNNSLEPAPQDRGQPTHFMRNRQKRIFGLVVPKDFGTTARVTWTIIRGSDAPQRASGSLDPRYRIEALRSETEGNLAPSLEAGSDQTIVLPQQATLTTVLKDDGKPQRGRGGRGGGTGAATNLSVQWRLYRGPGKVSFSEVRPAVGTDGKAVSTATFTEPGVYVLQAIAEDGSSSIRPEGNPGGGLCCFSDAKVTIEVKGAPGF